VRANPPLALAIALTIVAAGCLTQTSPPDQGTDASPSPTIIDGFRETVIQIGEGSQSGTLSAKTAQGALSTVSWTGLEAATVSFPENVFRFDPSSKRFSASHQANLNPGETLTLLPPPGMTHLELTINGARVTLQTPDTEAGFFQGKNIVEWYKVQRERFPDRCQGCPNYAKSQQYFAEVFRSFGYTNVEVDPYGTNAINPPFANVVATKYAKTDLAHPQWLGVGGHYDVVTGTTEGAFDNTAGTLATLELARAFANVTTDHNLLFGLWGGEESGLQGSHFYVRTNPQVGAQMRTYVNLDVNGFSWPGPAPVALDGSIPDCTTRPAHNPQASFFCPDPLVVSGGPDGPLGNNLLDLGRKIQSQIAVDWPDSYFIYEGVGSGQLNGYAGVNAQSDHTSFIAAGGPSFFLFNGDALRNPIGIHNQRDTLENWTRYMVYNFAVDLDAELSPEEVAAGEALIAKTFETYLWLTFYIFLHVELGLFSAATG
jgi:hypothetical protein